MNLYLLTQSEAANLLDSLREEVACLEAQRQEELEKDDWNMAIVNGNWDRIEELNKTIDALEFKVRG